MFLKSLVLHNFRCFSDLEVDFNNRLTVIVGNNGAGKSTVLEAATIAAGTLTSAMDGLTNYGIKKSDAHCQLLLTKVRSLKGIVEQSGDTLIAYR